MQVSANEMPRRRRLLRVLGVGLSLLGLVVLLVGFGLFPQEPLRRLVEDTLRTTVGRGSRLGGLHVTPFRLRAEMQDLRLEGSGFSLVASEVRLEALPRALTERAILLRTVEVEAPILSIRPAPDETAESREGGEVALPPILVEDLTLREGRVSWEDPGTGTLEISGLSVRGPLGAGALAVDADHGEWRGRTQVIFGPASARLAITDTLDAALESFELGLGSSRLAAHGPLLEQATFAPRLDLEARIDLADVGGHLETPRLLGDLTVTGRLEGRVGGEAGDLRLAVHAEGAPGWGEWRTETLAADLSADTVSGEVEAHVEGRALGGQLKGQVRLGRTSTRGELEARGLDLRRLPGGLPGPLERANADVLRLAWEGPVDGPLRVRASTRARAGSGVGSGRLEAEARGTLVPDEPRVDLDWTARIEGQASDPAALTLTTTAEGRAEGPLPPSITGTLSGTARRGEGAEVIESALTSTFAVRGDDVQARIDADGALLAASADVRLRQDRIERLSVQAPDVDLARLHPEASGHLRLDAEASGVLEAPAFSVQAEVAGLGWAGTSLGPAAISAEGDARSAEVRLALPDLAIGADGEWLGGPERRLRGRAELHDTPLAPLFALLETTNPFAGQVTASLGFDVPLDRPIETEATVDVSALEVTRAGETFRAQAFRAELADGRVAVSDLRVDGPGVSVDASVEAGVGADDPLQVRAWLDVDLSRLPWPEGWTVSGSLGGAVGLEGTRTRPSPTGVLYATDVSLTRPSLPEVQVAGAELWLLEDRLRIPPASARIGEGRATLEGEIPYAAAWPALRSAELTEKERSRLVLTWEGLAFGPLEGGLAGTLTLEGGLASLEEPEGVLELPARKLTLAGVSLEILPSTLRLEAGRVTTSGLTLRSARGDLEITGGADLIEDTLDVRGRGAFALGLLSPLLEDISVGGRAEVDLRVEGPLEAPIPRGRVTIEDVSLRMREMPQALTGVRGELALEGGTTTLKASGELGGGRLNLEGEAQVTGERLGDLWLQLTGRGVALRYPAGVRSRLDVDLTLAGQPGDFRLAGDVAVQGGVFDVETAVKEALRPPSTAGAGSDLLRDVALDVTVRLDRPMVVRSGFGGLEATGRINARGSLESPAPFGRLDVRRGGQILVAGQEFDVTGGYLSYAGDWNATLSLKAVTVLRNVDFSTQTFEDTKVRDFRDLPVTATLEGTVQEPDLTFRSTSDPDLSSQQIVAAIVTGNINTSLIDSSAWLVGGETAALATGNITSEVAQSFGLDQITIRPDLVARDTDPSARFTFGKRLGRSLSLIYSAGLRGPETRFAEVQYFPGHDIRLRALRRDTATSELGAGQRFEWGAVSPTELGEESRIRLDAVTFEGAASLEPRLRDALRLSPGKTVADWRLRQEADRLRRWLRGQRYLEAEVSVRLDGRTAVFSVDAGPVFDWRVEDMDRPPGLDRVLDRALFEADAIDLGRQRLLDALHERGHLRAAVQAMVEDAGNTRHLVFTVEPGPRFDPVNVSFPGRRSLEKSTLLGAAGGASGLLERPEAAVAAIQEAYRARHFLSAKVEPPQIEESGGALRITVRVDEGPRARLAWVRFEGASQPEGELRDAVALETGAPFSSGAVSSAIDRIRKLYLSRGYVDVRVRPEVEVDGQDLGLVLRVREGEVHRVDEVVLSGNTRTRDWIVERALDLEPGEPVDPRDLAAAERRLLRLGTFSRATIVPRPERPGHLEVRLEEAANLIAGYDVRWEEEEGWAGTVEGVVDNVLGVGVALGGRVRYGGSQREYRGSLHVPEVLAKGDVTGSVFRTEQDVGAADLEITRIQTGFQLQQSLGLPQRFQVLTAYRFRRNRTLAPTLPDIPIDVGGLNLSVFRTTQDDLLDPRRGAFLSLNLDIAPSWLGSDAPIFKTFAQAVFNRSFRKQALTWAHSYRVGLAWGLDGEPVISSERFNAGGPTSIRGYATNTIGPRGLLGEPTGGAAVLLMNQELRYRHHPTGLGAAVFWDAGNVFRRVEDVRLDFVSAVGAGLRWASPVGLLRMDFGVPLDRGPDDKGYRIFFGLGQAF
jgi:outer membrane protein assembly complex protein YaeT